MNERKWIRGEIAAWQAEGLIDGMTAERLTARYSAADGARRTLATLLVGAFGALLIGFGTIALFAANWDCFGRAARAAISVTPTAVCGVCALVAASRRVKSAVFWEPLSLLWSLAVIAGTSLVAQTYQVGGNVPGLILLVALLTLPIAWFVPAAISRILWLAFPFVWTVYRFEGYFPVQSDLWAIAAGGLLLTAVSIPGYLLFLRSKPGPKTLWWGQTLSGLAYSAGTAAILTIALFKAFYDLNYECGVMVFWLCAAIPLLVAIRQRLALWPYVCVLVAVCATFPLGCSKILQFYCAALLLGGGIVWWGVRTLSLAYTNLGSILLVVLILSKFFQSDLSFTVKGIVLILSGVVLTASNVLFIRFRRERRVGQ